jgi:hypothetical protein
MMLAPKKIGITFLSSVLLLGVSMAAPNLASADPPPWAPAHGYRAKKHHKKYHYTYYPSSQIYYSPVRRGYYYPYSGGWRFGVSLPSGISLGNGISIELGGPTPYDYHPTVIQQYPVVIVP